MLYLLHSRWEVFQHDFDLCTDKVDDEDDEEENDEDSDEDDELVESNANRDVTSDSDLAEIYDELKGKRAMMVVQDIFDWADIQDMIAEQTLTKEEVLKSVEAAGVTSASLDSKLSSKQFELVVKKLQEIDSDAEEGFCI